MSNSNIVNERSRHWDLLLYPNEDPTHSLALQYIQEHFHKYAYINHDKDISEETGELKKEHTHIVLTFENAKWRNSLALELGITPNYMQKSKDLNNSLKYLIHYNNENKFQYDISEVFGPLKEKLSILLRNIDKSEEEIIIELLHFIDYYPKKLSITDFVEYVCSKGLYSHYRRSQSTFKMIIDEHNFKISQQFWKK